MFIRINPYLCHLLTRYQSTIFPNHKSCVRKKGVPNDTFFICYVLYPGFFKQTVSVVRIEILVVIQKELCQYRVVVVHFQLAGVQTANCLSVFFR